MKCLNLSVLSVLISLVGCSKKDGDTTNVALFASVYLEIRDAQGRDLLNPLTDGHINTSNATLYYMINGNKVMRFNAHEDVPNGMVISENTSSGVYILKVLLNHNVEDGEISTNILEYADYSSDTIEVRIRKTETDTGYTELWINGEEVALNSSTKNVIIK